MSDNLSAAAEAMGLPEALVQRSAEARAAETGADVEEILAAWAGGEAPAASDAETEPVPEEAPEEQPEEPAEETVEHETEPEPAAPVVEAPQPEPAQTPAAQPPPAPTEVGPEEAAKVPVVVTVPTSGIKERTSFDTPRWLTAALLVAPLLALFALAGSATGACGEATELAIDVISGDIVNCDGSEFTGQAVGGPGGDFLAVGEAIYLGGEVGGVNCSGCHAASGQGAGTFPALTGALTTFGSCADHVEWVSLGTQGFQNEGRGTYGDTGKPVGGAGVMPGFAASLTPEQIAAVSAFERVRFGGADPQETLVDCGLAEPPGEEGEGEGEGEEGEAPTESDQEGATTTTP